MGNTVVYAIKIALTVAATMALVVAINAIVMGLVDFTVNSALGEIIRLICIYMPFHPGPFFATIIATMTAIISFLIAKKIYELTMKAQAAA